MFSHRDSDAVTSFVRIQTAAGAVLLASPRHYIWATQNGHDIAKLVKAGDLKPGGYVWTSSGNSSLFSIARSRIVSLKPELARGLYNPHTASGSIVVDGVAAATFTDTLPASVAVHTAVTLPARILYHILHTSLLREKVNGLLLASYNCLTLRASLI